MKTLFFLFATISSLSCVIGCAISAVASNKPFPESHQSGFSDHNRDNTKTKTQPKEELLNRVQFVDEDDQPIQGADVWIYLEEPTMTIKNTTYYQVAIKDLTNTSLNGTVPWAPFSTRFKKSVKHDDSISCAIAVSHEEFGISIFTCELADVIGTKLVVRDQRTSTGSHLSAAVEALQNSDDLRINEFQKGDIPMRVRQMWSVTPEGHLAAAKDRLERELSSRSRNPRALPEDESAPALTDSANSTWTVMMAGKPTPGHLAIVDENGWPTLFITDAWGRVLLVPHKQTVEPQSLQVYFLYDGDMKECQMKLRNGTLVIQVEL